jgi:hypothetical protein
MHCPRSLASSARQPVLILSLVRLRMVLLVLALLARAAAPAPAQVPEQVAVSETLVEVRLADGSTLFGRVVAVEGDRITLETQAGARVELRRSQIRSLRPVGGQVKDGEVWRNDPHATRLFFAPTGRSLARDEGYFGVYELFFPFVTYGLTSRVTVTGGTPIFPGAVGDFAYFGPKLLVVDAPRTQVSAGVFTGLFEGGLTGVLYGVGTFGDRDNALTTGIAFGFESGDGGSEVFEEPLVMLGGEARAGRNTKLLTENYFAPGESGALISGGIRFFGERLSADFGVGAFIGDGDAGCCLPLVNFVYSFGGQR